MTTQITTYLKSGLAGINHAALVAAIVVSFGLWYLNKLGSQYTSEVTLPVSIVDAPNSTQGVLENENPVECRIRATGYELLRYRMRPKQNRIDIELSRVELRPVEGTNRSEVTPLSLRNAIAEHLGEGVELEAILTPGIEIATARYRTKKLPVQNTLTFDYRNGYMAVGPVRFTPSAVEVRALDFVLDSLEAVETEPRRFSQVDGSVGGSIGLRTIPGAVFPDGEVEFELTVEKYTEVDLTLPVTLRNAPRGGKMEVDPAEVEVRLRVAGERSVDKIRPVIDGNEPAEKGKYRVAVSVPEGVEVGRIEPAAVELIPAGP